MKLTAERLRRGRNRDRIPDRSPTPEDEAYWREYLGEYLDETEVRHLLKIDTPYLLEELVGAYEILAVPTARGLAYPAFQFVSGAVNPTISRVVKIFSIAVATPYTTASWLRGARFEDKSVVEWIESGENPEVVIQAAEDSAARLAA